MGNRWLISGLLKNWDDAEDAHSSRIAEAAVDQWDAEGRPAGIPIEDIARDLGIDLPVSP